MSARLALWAIAPVVAAWREATMAGHPWRAPGARRWSATCVLYGAGVLAGVALLVMGIVTGRAGLLPVGGYLCAVGICTLGVRGFIPRTLAGSQAHLVALTSPETLTRAAIWAGLVWALVSQRWDLAFAFGLAAGSLASVGLVAGLIAHRVFPWRKQHERQP